jgi:Asp-tRNA(Asn)/Glu-tRNA(Gln) amidotransferase B subunit
VIQAWKKVAKKITTLLVGKAMTASAQGSVHPERLNEIVLEVLKEGTPLEEV